MDYEMWKLSIYDTYHKKYTERYKPKRRRFKDFDKTTKRQFIVTIISFFGGLGVYGYGMIFTKIIIAFIGLFIMTLFPAITIYRGKTDIIIFKNQIDVFKEVLEEQGLNNEFAIRKLEKETQGALGRIKDNNILNLIKIIFGVAGAMGVTTVYQKVINKYNVVILLIAIIIVPPICVAFYLILQCIPDGKIPRKKQLNQLLKVLMIYEGYKE